MRQSSNISNTILYAETAVSVKYFIKPQKLRNYTPYIFFNVVSVSQIKKIFFCKIYYDQIIDTTMKLIYNYKSKSFTIIIILKTNL